MYNEYNTDQTDILGVNVFGTRLRTPIGLAAGLDKDGEAIEALFNSGFSYVEIGSITPLPQPGNPPVSYTHLDVYKRQVLTDPVILVNIVVYSILMKCISYDYI